MHLTTKLFLAATLLAGNLFASFAGDVTLKITKKYINLPVSHQMGPEENDIRGERGSGT